MDYALSEGVNSQTITGLSCVFSKAAKNPEPRTVEEHIAKLDSDLLKRIHSFKDNPYKRKFFEEQRDKFLNILKEDLPEGYEFALVMVDPRVENSVLDGVAYEFDTAKRKIVDGKPQMVRVAYGSEQCVKKDFLKFLASEHKDDLKNIYGFSEDHINSMKEGYAPRGFSVDHIFERADNEALSTSKGLDPNNPYAKKEAFLVNHFSNLQLIPDPIHEVKNDIKHLQINLYNSPGSRYFMMLVPKSNEGALSYVAPKQVNKKYKVELHGGSNKTFSNKRFFPNSKAS